MKDKLTNENSNPFCVVVSLNDLHQLRIAAALDNTNRSVIVRSLIAEYLKNHSTLQKVLNAEREEE